jgi:hypothetical protein
MNEQEFENKIIEEVQRYESLDIKPHWNKKEVWNRIDVGLVKKNSSWWKAVAIILLLISVSWSYAQWNIFENYKKNKAMEVSNLKQQLDNLTIGQKEMTIHSELVMVQKNNELDSLKNIIHRNKTISMRMDLDNALQINNKTSENRGSNEEHLIDSLQSQLKLIKVMLANLQTEQWIGDQQPKKSENLPVNKPVPLKISTLLIENQELNHRNRPRLKFHFPGNSKNDNVVYKSDYSIFKK